MPALGVIAGPAGDDRLGWGKQERFAQAGREPHSGVMGGSKPNVQSILGGNSFAIARRPSPPNPHLLKQNSPGKNALAFYGTQWVWRRVGESVSSEPKKLMQLSSPQWKSLALSGRSRLNAAKDPELKRRFYGGQVGGE